MDRLSMSELTTFRWSFEQDVQKFSAAGLSAMGVWRQKLSDFGDDRGVELLRDTGLQVSSLHWIGGFTGSDGRSHKESVEDAREALELAVELQCKTLVMYTGSRAGHTHNHARRLAKGAIVALAPQAEELGVDLALEPMHAACASDCTFLTTLGEAVELIDDIGSPAVKLVLDLYHMGFEEKLLEQIAALADRISLVQIGDGRQTPTSEQNRCPLGEGMLPLGDMIAALRQGGYAGYFEVELLGEEFEPMTYDQILEQSMATARELLGAS
ncbi:sugar phosphate isomerase/epimerase family protein [Lignipirellula cremea]|uniref:Inosose isomerase n=1 Tax=Lignipirellula cremea TaxID=2528010 RepID=A0A518DYE6_9BACT|nr:sugar phosphate isomerase/epimerase family protein [Lignipirellula cremea]QDU96868.1 Inosose isomerase [Lignipirellula cremea]